MYVLTITHLPVDSCQFARRDLSACQHAKNLSAYRQHLMTYIVAYRYNTTHILQARKRKDDSEAVGITL